MSRTSDAGGERVAIRIALSRAYKEQGSRALRCELPARERFLVEHVEDPFASLK